MTLRSNMSMRLDHVVVLVADLESAVNEWAAHGFTVTPGGIHADGQTHNALIGFADGSYVELIAFRVPNPSHRWARYRNFWGLIDICFCASPLLHTVQQLRALGVAFTEPTEGGRMRPDGVVLRWRASFPERGDLGLPFLIEDLTPRELRVPHGNGALHANAARGIAQVRIGVLDLHAAQPAFDALLGKPEELPNARVYHLAGCSVWLHQPSAGSPDADWLARRGAGPLAITFAAPTPLVFAAGSGFK
ncbi:MAG: VOC family protein [Anaerolineae bacterium]|nr:VOC family protein [Thermoflexales bacterium]MDW8054053.1 VOC family protein [Anaerolineae bacterium]